MFNRSYFLVFATIVIVEFSACIHAEEKPGFKTEELKPAEPPAFKISSTVTRGEDELEGATFIVGDRVVEFDGDIEDDPEVVFNLKDMSWKDCESGKVTTLKAAEAWAAASLEKSKETRAKRAKDIPPELLSFVDLSLNPKFEVEEQDGVLKLNADALRYEVHNNKEISDDLRATFYRYDKLNAYRKAIVRKKSTPQLQLEADRIMAEHKYFPADFIMIMKAEKEEVRIHMKLKVSALTAEELKRVKEVLQEDAHVETIAPCTPSNGQ